MIFLLPRWDKLVLYTSLEGLPGTHLPPVVKLPWGVFESAGSSRPKQVVKNGGGPGPDDFMGWFFGGNPRAKPCWPSPSPCEQIPQNGGGIRGWAPYIHELCANVGSAATVTGGELVWVGPAKWLSCIWLSLFVYIYIYIHVHNYHIPLTNCWCFVPSPVNRVG